MDISKNTQLDLLYLTNPNFKLKYNEPVSSINKDEIKFYRKRILQTTKDYLRGKKLNPIIDSLFEEYASQLIKHYKFIDKKDIIQKEYDNIKNKPISKVHNFKLEENNKLMMKANELPKKTIKDFMPIVVKERKKKKLIIPKLKDYKLNDPENRTKGLKKEKSK